MTPDQRLALIELCKEEKELIEAENRHNAMVAASFQEQTEALIKRGQLHRAKAEDFFRSMGLSGPLNPLILMAKAAGIDD